MEHNKDINQLETLLENRYHEIDLDVHAICKTLNISRSKLHRIIKKETNKSSTEFINDFKIKKAIILLSDTNLLIKEIGHKVGYQNPKYFSRVFRNCTGMSPNSFRNTISNDTIVPHMTQYHPSVI